MALSLITREIIKFDLLLCRLRIPLVLPLIAPTALLRGNENGVEVNEFELKSVYHIILLIPCKWLTGWEWNEMRGEFE